MLNKKLIENVYSDSDVDLCDGKVLISVLYDNGYRFEEINIHEVAHDCKIWAMDMDCYLVSFTNSLGGVCDIYNDMSKLMYESRSKGSEPEAIFEACDWLLKNQL